MNVTPIPSGAAGDCVRGAGIQCPFLTPVRLLTLVLAGGLRIENGGWPTALCYNACWMVQQETL